MVSIGINEFVGHFYLSEMPSAAIINVFFGLCNIQYLPCYWQIVCLVKLYSFGFNYKNILVHGGNYMFNIA